MKETKSNWECVTHLMDEVPSIDLGPYAGYWFHKTPRRLLHSMSYYKFASKMIGAGKRVLDVGCNEGLGSYLLGKECGFCKGVDFDVGAIEVAKKNFEGPCATFAAEDFLKSECEKWDAIVSFDVIEHIMPNDAPHFLCKMAAALAKGGLAIIGTPSEISQQFASEISKKGHINIYSAERLRAAMQEVFQFVFFFAAHDEVVHTGYLPLAHYFIVIGCKPR